MSRRRARHSIPDFPPGRPKVPEVKSLVREIYNQPMGGAGCCMHIVLDDGNIEDDSIRYCLERAQHDLCRQVATMMLQMTKTQRRKL